ncbi:MAG TPA: tetratricopeptide repeat protein [Pyrinomonadaceae bacterium]|jgi:tetratricopeptide (TPR) repeat protein
MKRLALTLASLLCLLLVAQDHPAMTKDAWTSVRTRNFLVVGNASEMEMREVATRLEQFRLSLARLFIVNNFASPLATTVILFKNDSSYEPFKPLYRGRPAEVAGFFQPGRDTNYITLSAERLGETPYRTIFHEYVHLMIDSNLRGVPAWFNEGVAEYYSAFEVTDGGRRATLGRTIESHVQLIRRSPSLLPLRTLLAVDHSSPYYNESDKQGMFYAESWALVHYLIQANEGMRLPELMRYVNLLGAGTPFEDAFRQAFHTDVESMQRELEAYVRRFNAPLKVVPFDKGLEFDKEVGSAPLTDAQAQYYLGDLLRHMDRFEEAEARLRQALALDPDLGLAEASLGMLRVEQGRFREARAALERAVALDPQNYLVHYYYAFALSREGMDEEHSISGYAPEAARRMQIELRKAIELAPGFPESYHLLAFVQLALNERLDEAVALAQRALALSPGRYEFLNVLAQIYLRQEDYKSARLTLEPVIHTSADRQIREQAQAMLKLVVTLEESARRKPAVEHQLKNTETASANEAESDLTVRPIRSVLRKRFEGERVRGLLTNVECTETGVLLSVTVGERTLKLHNNSLRRIIFLTYVPEIKGHLTCGPRTPANPAIITYRPLHNAYAGFDGEAVAIEFIPDEEFDLEQ